MTKKGKKSSGFRENQAPFRLPRAAAEDVSGRIDLPNGTEMSFGDRFQFALRLLPAKKRETALGLSDKTLRSYGDASDVSLETIMLLSKVTGIPSGWIIYGSGDDNGGVPVTDEDVPVQKFALKPAAGGGTLVLEEHAESVRFPVAILRMAGVEPRFARLMEASGESMRPTINDGDWMLVDVSPAASQIAEGKIYTFAIGDEAFVKRLRRIGQRIRLISDNREMFPEEDAPAEPPMRIFGRVKWSGRIL